MLLGAKRANNAAALTRAIIALWANGRLTGKNNHPFPQPTVLAWLRDDDWHMRHLSP
jgi:hypothetical protein